MLVPRPTGSGHASLFAHWAGNIQWVRYSYITGPVEWTRILAVMLAGVLGDRVRILPRMSASPVLAKRVLVDALPIASRLTVEFLPGHCIPVLIVTRGRSRAAERASLAPSNALSMDVGVADAPGKRARYDRL